MTPNRTDRALANTERGFLLVGVVMFVLALTILGISLFGLSSYEAEFLQQSQDESQAFYDASGGIERAKAVLTVTGRLEAVQASLPSGVDSTIAIQNGLTVGPVIWDPSKPVTIRVVGAESKQGKMLEATFRPQPDDDYYRRLVTASTGIIFNLKNNLGELARPGVNFYGEDWQGSADYTSWATVGTPPAHSSQTGVPPKPDVLTYLSDPAHFAAAAAAPAPDGSDTYDLTQGTGTIRLFSSSFVSGRYALDDHYASGPTISIRDTVIWMFDRGASFFTQVTVVGGPNDCLVMIAHQNYDASQGEPTLALNFGGGLTAPGGSAVILVADGKIDLEHFGQSLRSSDQASYISIYADSVLITGPVPPPAGTSLNYFHAPGNTDPRDQPGGLIDRLASLGYLPGEFSGGGKFAFVSGSWLQSSNPY